MTLSVRCEVFFGAGAVGEFFTLDDPVRGELDNEDFGLAPDDVATDVTEFTATGQRGGPLVITRGRSRELDVFTAGTAELWLDNDDRRFEPTNTDSPYHPGVKPRRRMRITCRVGGDEFPLFAGFVEDWPVSWAPPEFSLVQVQAHDALGMLAGADLAELAAPAHAGETTGGRIRRVLEDPQVAFPRTYDVDDGITTVMATTFGQSALEHLHLMNRSESGYLFVAADGTLTFRDRHHTLLRDPEAVFADEPGAGVVPYRDVRLVPSTDLLFNRVVVSAPGVDDVVAEDPTSMGEFLVSTLSWQVATADEAEREAQADYLLQRFAQPEVRFTDVVFDLHALPANAQRTLLGLDIADVVMVERSPGGDGEPATLVDAFVVEHLRHEIGAVRWTMTLGLARADTRSFLLLDDPTFGLLDVNRLAY